MFIQTEQTPNPATLKFLPGRQVLPDGTADYRSKAEAASSPLAKRLFDIKNVTGVFFGADFVSVTKSEGEWRHLKPAILGAIMDYYGSGDATDLIASSNHNVDENYDPEDAELVATIKELLDTRVRPAVAQDGGDITFQGYSDGIVYLSMRGACAGCPSSTATLHNGIENLIRHFCPMVRGVEAV
ncbi:MAG: Fe/S biogenesis protein NfuA [Hyphomicrobiaceae bacterium hypho_1]